MDNIAYEFFDDFAIVLKKWNHRINSNIAFSIHDQFYKGYENTGISIWSITEPVLKFLAFYELCIKYKIRLEDHVYGDTTKLMDISLFVDSESDEDNAEYGFELKRVNFTNAGILDATSIDKLISEFEKIKLADVKFRYMIHLGSHSNKIDVTIDNLKDQVLKTIDQRLFRRFKLQPLAVKRFPLCSEEDCTINDYFYMILWYLDETA